MSLSAELEALRNANATKIDGFLNRLSPEDRKLVEDALESPEWSSEGLARFFTKRGTRMSSTTVRRYRRNVLGMSL